MLNPVPFPRFFFCKKRNRKCKKNVLIPRQPRQMHWWDQHVEDLETTDLEEICHQVLDLYAQPVTATKDALVSPPPGAAPKVSHFSLFLGCELIYIVH